MFRKAFEIFKFGFYYSNLKKPPVLRISNGRFYSETETTGVQTDKNIGHVSSTDKATVLKKLLNIKLVNAMDVVTSSEKFRSASLQKICNNFELIKSYGIGAEAIAKYPDVLLADSLESKFRLMKTLPYKLEELVPLLNMNLGVLMNLFRKGANARIEFYTKLFKISVPEICDVLRKRPFLCKANMDLIKIKCDVLLNYGISMENIQNDYWVLRYRSIAIQKHLQNAKDQDVDKMKTWMVRAQPKIFNNYILRRQENKAVLGDHTIEEYLVKKLKCSNQEAQILLDKHPVILNKKMKNIDNLLEFLLSEGFTTQHILTCSKILLHSMETTKERLRELQSKGIEIDNLHILIRSQKQYMNSLRSLEKKKNKFKMETT